MAFNISIGGSKTNKDMAYDYLHDNWSNLYTTIGEDIYKFQTSDKGMIQGILADLYDEGVCDVSVF